MHSLIVHEWESTNPADLLPPPVPPLTRNLSAPFMHSLIVHEWESTNPADLLPPPVPRSSEIWVPIHAQSHRA
jgi:hypothetical protein